MGSVSYLSVSLKERLGAIMKSKDFPKKIIYLACVLLIIICGTVYFGIARNSANPESRDAITYADESSMQRQWDLKEIEVKQALCDYDKDNIEEVAIYVETSANEIISANIFVASKDKITDEDEQDKIKTIASELLNLDAQNINIEYNDSETFPSRK